MKNPSMREIAEKVGVSTASVSMALRNHPQISGATRERILRIADEMGYRPNPMVSSLMAHIRSGRQASRGSTIAILGPKGTKHALTRRTDFDYPQVLYRSLVQRAEELGYSVDIFSADEPSSSLRQLARVVEFRSIRGILLPPFPSDQQDIPVDFKRDSTAVVAIGYSQNLDLVNRVTHDQFKIAFETTLQCIRRGYKRIGMQLQQRFNARTGHNYISAFLGAHQESNREARAKCLFLKDEFEGAEVIDWLRREKIDCLVAQDPRLHALLEKKGFEIPAQCGFATISWNEKYPGLSGMYHDPEELGHVAIDVLTAHIQRNECGIPKIPKTVMVTPRWMERTSLRAPV